mmetsp:Transcript_9720/g.12134  ORF Transcript_9720/g.12134 Transcript_9720/m.12134 type:complete len:107 (-) Transcript_9720:265-585(-)
MAESTAKSRSESTDYVKLISAEDHEFLVERSVAMKSATINAMLTGSFQESSGVVRFPEISTHILEKVINYLHYNVKYSGSKNPIPQFPIEREIAWDLMMAANFLDC